MIIINYKQNIQNYETVIKCKYKGPTFKKYASSTKNILVTWLNTIFIIFVSQFFKIISFYNYDFNFLFNFLFLQLWQF